MWDAGNIELLQRCCCRMDLKPLFNRGILVRFNFFLNVAVKNIWRLSGMIGLAILWISTTIFEWICIASCTQT